MKVYKNLITPYKDFTYSGPLDVSLFSPRPGYGVEAIKDCDVDVAIYLEEGEEKEVLKAEAEIEATLILIDSRTLEKYEENIRLDEEALILSSLLEEGEGYVFPENPFLLEDLIFGMILSDRPISSRREHSPLPPSGDGYSVYIEGEEEDDGVEYNQIEDESEE